MRAPTDVLEDFERRLIVWYELGAASETIVELQEHHQSTLGVEVPLDRRLAASLQDLLYDFRSARSEVQAWVDARSPASGAVASPGPAEGEAATPDGGPPDREGGRRDDGTPAIDPRVAGWCFKLDSFARRFDGAVLCWDSEGAYGGVEATLHELEDELRCVGRVGRGGGRFEEFVNDRARYLVMLYDHLERVADDLEVAPSIATTLRAMGGELRAMNREWWDAVR